MIRGQNNISHPPRGAGTVDKGSGGPPLPAPLRRICYLSSEGTHQARTSSVWRFKILSCHRPYASDSSHPCIIHMSTKSTTEQQYSRPMTTGRLLRKPILGGTTLPSDMNLSDCQRFVICFLAASEALSTTQPSPTAGT